ncbi:hypothetical protein NA57DRAFT_67259 [Rhizodiscina lignyota]|uniref:NADH dehydrogenase [ubiquinone] 1 alpha subcomplex subunit n=1 Tax=Rhizodiscina lignyota TaxID=1504668 RepID=A0A9P4IAN7_9PEZI|nr:hypothetical protein NA57DRAFT_67259 [Rhizodiscina lignyota]
MSGSLRQLWYRWKSLKLPWRRQWLCGTDLAGNTFWEFRDQRNAGRIRRIARFRWKTHHGDVELPPQWIQWLRHTRADPPSINEQKLDQVRQIQLKQLAAEADRRWAEKPSFLDPPSKQQPSIGISSDIAEPQDAQGTTPRQDGPKGKTAEQEKAAERARREEERERWRRETGQPAPETQPEGWSPKPTRRR